MQRAARRLAIRLATTARKLEAAGGQAWRTSVPLSCRVEGRVHGFLCAALLQLSARRNIFTYSRSVSYDLYETAQTHLVAWNTGSMHAR